MTYMYEKHAPQYHWIPELYRRLNLPVYDGIQEALELFNQQRKAALDKLKTEEAMRRVQLKRERTKETQVRKAWSNKHGHDTYGDGDHDIEPDDKLVSRGKKRQKVADGKCPACGSTTHKRSNHRDCPFNKRRVDITNLKHTGNIQALPDDAGYIQMHLDDLHCESKEFDESYSSSTDDCVLEGIISGALCVCGAINRAHKKCPMSSRNSSSRVLFPSDDDYVSSKLTAEFEAVRSEVVEATHVKHV